MAIVIVIVLLPHRHWSLVARAHPFAVGKNSAAFVQRLAKPIFPPARRRVWTWTGAPHPRIRPRDRLAEPP